MSYSENFKKAMENIGDVVKDISELNVRTFGGSLVFQVQDGQELDWNSILKNAKNSGIVTLKLSTDIKIDGDADLFIADDATTKHQEAHQAALAAGKESRAAIIKFIKDIVEKIT
ncbi:MAG: hypothetical protein QNK37_12265 [Acidobacteriota bacterium]|nr:hypothetical protein [Acidobacteriota bacterium]